MPSFADSIFLFILALLLFGPKKLPVLARELGKWMGEFRRASNEFKMQMEDELRASEQAERQKQIAAMEAAAPIPPPLDEPAEPEHPHMRNSSSPAVQENSILPPRTSSAHTDLPAADFPVETLEQPSEPGGAEPMDPVFSAHGAATSEPVSGSAEIDTPNPIPIATSGSLKMMPPSTGLPTPRSRGGNGALSTLVDAIPEAAPTSAATPEPESLAHGD